MNSVAITTFYRFLPLTPERCLELQSQLEILASEEDLLGLCLLATEGINATISGPAAGLSRLKSEISTWLNLSDLQFKDSLSDHPPFRFFKVKIKPEIVSLGQPGVVPDSPRNHHLSPAEWERALKDPNAVVIDTRNRYETAIGKFNKALDLQMDEFNEFGEKLKSAGVAKDKQVLIYCTGGIRCEKAILEMEAQGYRNVHQLDGGILNYLKEFPDRQFDGECFVFDYRVAVDQNLNATRKYKLCPHCGQPAAETVACLKCGREEYVCAACLGDGDQACSKNCAHHLKTGTGSSKTHRQEYERRHRTS